MKHVHNVNNNKIPFGTESIAILQIELVLVVNRKEKKFTYKQASILFYFFLHIFYIPNWIYF